MSQLDAGHPVVFTGYVPGGNSGHNWVCDGYTEVFTCSETGGWVGANGYLYYHMNFGWSGSHNGYFGYNNFINANANINYNYNVNVFVGLY